MFHEYVKVLAQLIPLFLQLCSSFCLIYKVLLRRHWLPNVFQLALRLFFPILDFVDSVYLASISVNFALSESASAVSLDIRRWAFLLLPAAICLPGLVIAAHVTPLVNPFLSQVVKQRGTDTDERYSSQWCFCRRWKTQCIWYQAIQRSCASGWLSAGASFTLHCASTQSQSLLKCWASFCPNPGWLCITC